ncbi:class I SAM-dependent methyltransferase [Agromyces sp. MMS24-JH15]|uniref:class I SAM-dependent methyltransferase n=1 Tax=Agromyces sp. MMS24-JH15 TaxID=3243765 RepID=UPI0037496060
MIGQLLAAADARIDARRGVTMSRLERFNQLFGRRAVIASAATLLGGVLATLVRRNPVWLSLASQLVTIAGIVTLTQRSFNERRVGVHAELWSMQRVRDLVDPDGEYNGPWGPVGVDPEFMHEIVGHLVTNKDSPTVLELGSGASTIWMALALRKRGAGRLISLEQDRSWASITTARLRSLGLDAWAEVRVAPTGVSEKLGWPGDWYTPAALADVEGVSVVLVDGPEGTLLRQNAFPGLANKLAAECVVFVDDFDLPPIRTMVKQWLRDSSIGTGYKVHSRIGRGGVLAPSSRQA